MAYTIIVGDNNSLYGSSKKKIVQGEKLFNKLWFLVAPYYKGYDMSQCTVTMRYLLPISKEYNTEILTLSEEKYEEYLKYVLPVNSNLTKEYGDVELNLTFMMRDVDDDDNAVQRIRKTTNHILKITQDPDLDDIIPDPTLPTLGQKIVKVDVLPEIGDLETIYICDFKFYFWNGVEYITPISNTTELAGRVEALETKVGEGFIAIENSEINTLFNEF